MALYNSQIFSALVFDNRRTLETYCQDDVKILKKACRVFRGEFMQKGNNEFSLEAITIASACNKVLLKRFLEPETIGLIPTGVYTDNVKYSKKALMRLVHGENNYGHAILHGRNVL